MNIYIIGNGFDLYHGLPSRYADFANWLSENNSELFEDIGKYYGIPVFTTIQCGPDIEVDGYYVYDKFWWCFEKELGAVDTMAFENQLLDDLGLENDDPVDIGKEINADGIAYQIKHEFARWIASTVDTDRNYDIIKKIIGKNRIPIDDQSIFISFNYTHTLQKVYRIPNHRIYYIHGECEDEDSQLVVGHGNIEELKRLDRQINALKEDYHYTQAEMNRIREEECMRSFLSALKKDVDRCIVGLSSFMSKISEPIEHIYSLGFSCNEVDIPYISYLRQKYNNAQWHISRMKRNVSEEKIEIDRLRVLLKDPDFAPSFFKFYNSNSNMIRRLIGN